MSDNEWGMLIHRMPERGEDISDALPCHICGYDLRVHPADGKCPECGASVAEARRLAAIPRRPAWADSDPRWRRRILAGVWILLLVPLMELLTALGWAASIPMPTLFNFRGILTLDQTFLGEMYVYPTLCFCIGMALLFSTERGRRAGHLDWTRRWGVLCSYVVLLLSAAHILFLAALVLMGIAELFLSMPPKYQPSVTQWIVDLSTTYAHYGPYPKSISTLVLLAFASITVLLGCVALFDALRSSGPKLLAATLLAPIALFAVIDVVQVGQYCVGIFEPTLRDFYRLGIYFRPHLLVGYYADLHALWSPFRPGRSEFVAESTKWCCVLTIAIWLSIAQLGAWRNGKKLNRG